MSTQIQEAVALASALFMGYGIGRYRRPKQPRCSATASAVVTWDDGDEPAMVLRCNEDAGHSGPHGAWWRWQKRWWWGTSEPKVE